MQAQRCSQVTKSGAVGELGLADPHRVKLAFDILAPEIEKPAQLGEIRGKVELLPDEALQQVWVIGQVVDNLSCGQPILTKLRAALAHRDFRRFALAYRENASPISLEQQKNKR
jgi:hypothetical protein